MREPGPLEERPMEGFIGFLCLASGLPMVVFGLAPDSATSVMPEILVRTWGAVLTMGGSLVLTGILQRYSRSKFVLGLLIERAGYWPLISGTLVFSIVIAIRAGIEGLFPILTYVVFSVVCFLRQRHIRRLLSRLDGLTNRDE